MVWNTNINHFRFFPSSSSSSSGVIFWRSIFQKPDFLWQKITLLHYYGLDTTYYYGKKYAVVGDNSDGYEAKTASLAYKPMKQLGFSGSIGSCFIHIHLHPCLSICMFVWVCGWLCCADGYMMGYLHSLNVSPLIAYRILCNNDSAIQAHDHSPDYGCR